MILVDTAPLIALIDAGQGKTHHRCTETYHNLDRPMLTTWCCFTEAMYFLHQLRGWQAQNILWQFVERKAIFLHSNTSKEQERMRELMKKYRDVPMDLADASLVATAETFNSRQIFTLDRDFFVYRLFDKEAFEVIPNIID